MPASASCAILCPLRRSAFLTVRLPAPPSRWVRTATGLPRSPDRRTGRVGRPLDPGVGGVLPADKKYSAGTRGFPTAKPCTPAYRFPFMRGSLTRHYRGFTHVRPSDHSLRPSFPRMEQETFGFAPGLRTPPLPATHAERGDRPSDIEPFPVAGWVVRATRRGRGNDRGRRGTSVKEAVRPKIDSPRGPA